MNPKRKPNSQTAFQDVWRITAKTGIRAMKATGHTPLADMKPGEAISSIAASMSPLYSFYYVTQQAKNNDEISKPCSKTVRKVLNKIKDIKRKIFLLERDHNIENPMYINPHFCYFIEYWIGSNLNPDNNPLEAWENMFADTEYSQGDVVRTFKRTIAVSIITIKLLAL